MIIEGLKKKRVHTVVVVMMVVRSGSTTAMLMMMVPVWVGPRALRFPSETSTVRLYCHTLSRPLSKSKGFLKRSRVTLVPDAWEKTK